MQNGITTMQFQLWLRLANLEFMDIPKYFHPYIPLSQIIIQNIKKLKYYTVRSSDFRRHRASNNIRKI